jgi:hypothetical protein
MSESTPRPATGPVLDVSRSHPFDLAIMACGAVAFLASFLPYYTVSIEGFDIGFGGGAANAWHGFFGWFGAVSALAGAVLLALHLAGRAPLVPVRPAVLAAMGLAAASTLAAVAVIPGWDCGSDSVMAAVCDVVDLGHGVGYWTALAATAVGTALAAVRRSAG